MKRRGLGVIALLMFLFLCVLISFMIVPVAMAADGAAGFDWGSLFFPLVGTVLTALGVLLGRLIVAGINAIKSNALRAVVWQAVMWAEQRFKGASGSVKFKAVLDRLADRLPFVSREDLELMIEAAVGEMNTQSPKVQGSSPA